MPWSLPTLRDRSLATLARAARPTRSHHLEPDGQTRGRVPASTPYPSSLAKHSLRRQTPKVGARCVNHARRDLCGGCAAMRIPTAIEPLEAFLGFRRGLKPPLATRLLVCQV